MKDLWQNKLKRHVLIFTIVSLAIGWVGVLIDMVITDQPDEETLGMLVWILAPLLCAVILNFKSKDWWGFGHKLNLKTNIGWYLFAIFIFPVVFIVFGFIAYLFGALEIGTFNISVINLVIASLFGLFIKNIFEDFAWRGFLTAKLIKLKFSDLWIYLFTGLVWALWHAAYYMVFLPDEIFIDFTRFGIFGISLIVIPIWGVLFTEIYRITGSVWPVVIMHMVEDAVPTMLIQVEQVFTFTGAAELWLNPLQGILPLIVYLLIGLWIRSMRIKLNRPVSI